jgi:hypothetical protein
MDEHRERIKQRIRNSIDQFKNGVIDFNSLDYNVTGNINALDNIDEQLRSAARRLCGRLEIIHYTIDSDKEFEAMLKEVEKFEPYIDKI